MNPDNANNMAAAAKAASGNCNAQNAYAQIGSRSVASAPPTLLEELRNRQAKLALLLAANGDERANLLRQAEDLTKAIAALSPAAAQAATPVPVGFVHQQPERFRYHVRSDFTNGRIKSSFHESLDEAETEYESIRIDPLLDSVTLEDVTDPASVTLLRQYQSDVPIAAAAPVSP